MTTNEFYKQCIEMVEVCECGVMHDCEKCLRIEKSFGSDAGKISYQNKLTNITTLLQLSYYMTNLKIDRTNRISRTIVMKLEKNHCGKFSEQQEYLSLAHLIGGGIGAVCFLLLLIIVIVIIVLVRRKKGSKNEEEIVDINPNYGYKLGSIDTDSEDEDEIKEEKVDGHNEAACDKVVELEEIVAEKEIIIKRMEKEINKMKNEKNIISMELDRSKEVLTEMRK